MSKQKLPDTSLSAYKQLKSSDMQSTHWNKIKEGLEVIGKGTYEQIAAQTKLDKHQIHRRICEMERQDPPLIYKTTEKRDTVSGRKAYVYQLVPLGETPVPRHIPAVPKKEPKQKASTTPMFVQESLFSNL